MMKPEEYIGDENQLISYEEGVLTDGYADGVRFMKVENGGNLSAAVLPGRCMDIYQVRFHGKNMNYLAPCGIKNCAAYDGTGDHFLRNFFVGQLTTVGLQNLGPAREVYGETQGLHGRIGNTPAANVSYVRETRDGARTLTLRGTMREARIFGENLSLARSIRFEYGRDRIVLDDTVTNYGFLPREFALLYHINFGYPLLAPDTELILDTEKVTPRTEEAAKYADTWNVIEEPAAPYPERCYFHQVKKDESGLSRYEVRNKKLGLAVRVTYSGEALPHFCEWKMLGKGEYVLGLEPSNVFMDGPAPGETGSGAPVLQPGESLSYRIVFDYLTL